jgi:hypothetical protein
MFLTDAAHTVLQLKPKNNQSPIYIYNTPLLVYTHNGWKLNSESESLNEEYIFQYDIQKHLQLSHSLKVENKISQCNIELYNLDKGLGLYDVTLSGHLNVHDLNIYLLVPSLNIEPGEYVSIRVSRTFNIKDLQFSYQI